MNLSIGGNLIGIEKHINKTFGTSCLYDLSIWFGDLKDVFFLFEVIIHMYDTEKNKTSVLAEFNLDSSEIRAIRHLNEKTYIMLQNKVFVFVYLCFN